MLHSGSCTRLSSAVPLSSPPTCPCVFVPKRRRVRDIERDTERHSARQCLHLRTRVCMRVCMRVCRCHLVHVSMACMYGGVGARRRERQRDRGAAAAAAAQLCLLPVSLSPLILHPIPVPPNLEHLRRKEGRCVDACARVPLCTSPRSMSIHIYMHSFSYAYVCSQTERDQVKD